MGNLVLAVGMALMTVGGGISYCLRTTGIFTATAAAIIAAAVVGGDRVLASLLLSLSGMEYVILYLALCVRRMVTERKRRRAEVARRLCYTLPDRENEYVRQRLNTALNADMGGLEEPINLAYARGLLCKLKGEALTQAERLQIEETERAFAVYLAKEKWSAAELRAVNELCASLLKLSAKYAI